MKKTAQFMSIPIILLLALFSTKAQPQETGSDKTLSPYFLVNSDDPLVDQLPLKSTSAEVNIAGVIADVTIKQVYKNEGTKPLEAIYVFPASTRAAIYGMKMIVGDRTITAEIQERNQARQIYEEAKEAGKRTSLLEQQRPNVFQMNVANIQPGDEIRVILSYTELLRPESGEYEFVYPTVVGPRYSGETTNPTSHDQFLATPYLREGNLPPYEFDLSVWLSAGMPIQNVTCSSHKVKLNYEGTTAIKATLDANETNGGNRDFILKYRLAGDEIQEGLLLYEHGDENYFLLMMQPPKQVTVDQIPPREYIFIVDVSGSMHGFPLDISKKLMRNLITGLRPNDKFNVLLFAGSSSLLAEHSLAASSENLEQAVQFIDRQQGGGATNLLPALQRALRLPRAGEGISRSVVVVTDGYVSVETEAFDLIRTHLDEANLFAFGIGSSVNRHLIEGMAHVGQGEPAIITKQEEAGTAAEKFQQYIQSPVLTGIKTDFGKFTAYDVEPASIPDVMAGRPVIIFGKYKGKPSGDITVKGYSGNKKFKASFAVNEVKPDLRNAALRYLWARERIRLLNDYNDLSHEEERVKEVTHIGLAYNLMTAYTSFVAVDREVVKNESGEIVKVKQPLPLPEGVSNYAVGFSPAIEGMILKEFQKGIFASFSSGWLLRITTLVLGLVFILIGWRRMQ